MRLLYFFLLIFCSHVIDAQILPRLVLPVGHPSGVDDIEFSPSGKFFLSSGSSEETVKLWETSSGKLINTFKGEFCFFAGSDETIFTVSRSENKGRVWDTRKNHCILSIQEFGLGHEFGSGGRIYRWEGSKRPPWNITVNETGQYVLAPKLDRLNLQVLDLSTGKVVFELKKDKEISYAMFGARPNEIIVAFDGGIEGWRITDGKLQFSLEKIHGARITFLNLDHRKESILTSSEDGTAKVWSLNTRQIQSALIGHSQEVDFAGFDTGNHALTISRDTHAKVWNPATGDALYTLAEDSIIDAVFSPDGRRFLTIQGDGFVNSLTGNEVYVKIWETATGKCLQTLNGKDATITNAKFNFNGELIATSTEDGRIFLWDSNSGELTRTIAGSVKKATYAEFSPNADLLGFASGPNARLLRTKNGSIVPITIAHESRVTSLRFFRYSDSLVTSSGGQIGLWNVSEPKLNTIIDAHSERIFDFDISDDQKLVATASEDGSVKLLSTNAKRVLASFNIDDFWLEAIDLSSNNQVMAIAPLDEDFIRIVSVSTGKTLRKLRYDDGATSINFDSKGQRIVSGSYDNTCNVWDVSSGRKLLSLVGHERPVNFVRFDPTDKLIVSASDDHTAKVWNAETGQLIQTLIGHSDVVESAVFSQKGDLIVTTSNDCLTIIWDAATGRQLLAFAYLDSNDLVVTHPSGLFDATPGAMDKLYFVQGLDVIDFEQLKERYYEPGLWKKVMSGEKLRDVSGFKTIDLPPDLAHSELTELNNTMLTVTNRDGGIGQVTVSVNGLEIIEDLRPKGFDPNNKTWTYELKLAALPNLKRGEENMVEVRAWNMDHWVISRPLQIRFTPPATRGASAEVEDKNSNQPMPRIFVLASGISDYEGTKIDLKYAAKDALSISRSLEMGAKKLFGADKAFVYTLTDSSAIKPTKTNIQNAFKDIASKSTPYDLLVVYLSGHGINWGGDNGDFYYLTKDAYSTDLQAYNDPGIRDKYTISSKELIELFKSVPSDKRVLMIDACASGKMVQNLVESRDISSSTLRALDKLKDRTGFHIITGCAADAVSYEASRFGQGVLTYSLIEGIKGASLDQQKFVDVNLLFQHARERVPELAKGIGGIQTPQVFSPKGAQSFPIGELDDELKKKIPLPKTRPIYVRSVFIDEDNLDDSLDLGAKLDLALNEISAKGEKAKLLFLDVNKFDDGCRVSGKYRKVGANIQLTYKAGCNSNSVTITAPTADQLVEQVVRAIGAGL